MQRQKVVVLVERALPGQAVQGGQGFVAANVDDGAQRASKAQGLPRFAHGTARKQRVDEAAHFGGHGRAGHQGDGALGAQRLGRVVGVGDGGLKAEIGRDAGHRAFDRHEGPDRAIGRSLGQRQRDVESRPRLLGNANADA